MSTTLKDLLSLGKELSYEGEQLRIFVKEEQDRERDERELQRQEDKMKRELEMKKVALEETQKKMDHEERLKELDIEAQKVLLQKGPKTEPTVDNLPHVRLKLPCFDQSKDDMDAFITRFEMYCATQAIPKGKWNLHLSTLLTGEALNVYWRQPVDDIDDYEKLKIALLKRFKLTADGYRNKFRAARSEDGESTFQYLSRLKSYVDRWVQMSELDPTYENLSDLIVCEQFLKMCNRDLSTFLLEISPGGLDLIATAAEQYMLAHNLQHACDYKRGKSHFQQRPQQSQTSLDDKQHFNKGNPTNSKQTKVSDSVQNQRFSNQCFVCGKTNHIARNCFHNVYNKPKVNFMKFEESSQKVDINVKKQNNSDNPKEANRVQGSTQSDSKLVLSLMSSDSFKDFTVEGNLNGFKVNALRDSGSSELVVAKKYVLDPQFTGKKNEIIFLDNSRCKVEEAFVDIDCPYLKGNKLKASVMENPLVDVVVGNVPGVREVNGSGIECEVANIRDSLPQVNVHTRSMESEKNKLPKPLNVVPSVLNVSKCKMLSLQSQDSSLSTIREGAVLYDKEISHPVKSFVIEHDLLYRISPSNYLQLVIPKDLRSDVMKIAHEGLLRDIWV